MSKCKMSKIYPSMKLVCYICFSNKILKQCECRGKKWLYVVWFLFLNNNNKILMLTALLQDTANYQSSSKPFFPVGFLSSELLKHSVVLSVINIFCNCCCCCYLVSLSYLTDFLRPGTILLILNPQLLALHRTHAYT